MTDGGDVEHDELIEIELPEEINTAYSEISEAFEKNSSSREGGLFYRS